MSKKILIIKKEEAYSYDELAWLEEKLLPMVADKNQKAALAQILSSLKAGLENQKASMALFFMPQSTFNIFSLIQGDNSICKIEKENIAALFAAFALLKDLAGEEIYFHLQKKIKTLNEYLQQGNQVTPTVIQADNFSTIEIS